VATWSRRHMFESEHEPCDTLPGVKFRGQAFRSIPDRQACARSKHIARSGLHFWRFRSGGVWRRALAGARNCWCAVAGTHAGRWI
jgi:hypothetical protein